MKNLNIAIVGATGVVGQTFLTVLEESPLQVKNLYLYASARSEGKVITFRGKNYSVETLGETSFQGRAIDYALFSAGGETSKNFAPLAAAAGAIVVDNSSAWRMDAGVPLVVPEVNLADARTTPKGIIANPNCSTIQAMLPLKVLADHYGLKRVLYATYQAVSGAGSKGIRDLEGTLRGDAPAHFPYNISKSCIPHIDVFAGDDYTKEEIKMVNETRKILHLPSLPVTATCVRVPILNGHSVAIMAETEQPFDIAVVKRQLGEFPGLVLQDNVSEKIYPVAEHATGRNEVFVGRIRRDLSQPNSLHIWCVADNIRKGAAANAVQIVEQLEL
ncbi:MAG: aspartate-semialdehyde dehydrogenase [Prevotellaceae bacterium]|jgi:aspartate-semialdehyde dehydrogenase|nr:aspartate-semialdehyde dehydrogenase [Prevotellaceae bacterium]